MLFNSISYALFLPIVFALYWAIPQKIRWILLLLASYFFYMSWNPKYIVLIILTTGISFVSAILIEKSKNIKVRRVIVFLASLLCLGILFFFKYFNFLSNTVISILKPFLLNIHPVTLEILLPVGISFYTFQTVSYILDVYHEKVSAERNFGIYATFVSFFPQLVAGPIERTSSLLPQIKTEKQFDYDKAIYGARLMLWGFFKKIAVADTIAPYVDNAYANLRNCSQFDLCCAVFLFSIQIYCDFSGYSDIAIGTAKLFGIDLIQNFKAPYFAKSIKDFWGRWHISLSSWFRDYVYIPLGGSRCSKCRNCINILVTFLLSGLWHGANWTFVVWGGLHGLGQIIEKMIIRDKKYDNVLFPWIKRIGVFLFVSLCWIFFRADNFNDAFYVISHLFAFDNNSGLFNSNFDHSVLRMIFCVLSIAIVMIYDYISLEKDIIECMGYCKRRGFVYVFEYIVLSFICLAIFKGSGSNQFVYFQF